MPLLDRDQPGGDVAMGDDEGLDPDLLEIVFEECAELLDDARRQLARLRVGDRSVVDTFFRSLHTIKGNVAMAGLNKAKVLAHELETGLGAVRDGGEVGADLLQALDRGLDDLAALIGPEDDVNEGETGGRDSTSGLLRILPEQLDPINALVGELLNIEARLSHVCGQASASAGARIPTHLLIISNELHETVDELFGALSDLQKVSSKNLVQTLERALRETCRLTEHEAVLKVEGADDRIGRDAIELVREPLLHMIRNAVDHGIEAPAERSAVGKSSVGLLTLTINVSDDEVSFTLRDDGRGIDPERVAEKLIVRGLASADAVRAMGENELLGFLFQPGFSTRETVSDVSGRGVGLDVVMRRIVDAEGEVQLTSDFGSSTTLKLTVPRTRSPIVHGLTARLGDATYLVPLRYIERLQRWSPSCERADPAGRPLLDLREGLLPRLELNQSAQPSHERSAVLVLKNRAGRRAALVVDAMVGTTKALTDELDLPWLERTSIQRAFILGDSSVGFLVDVERLFEDVSRRMATDGSTPEARRLAG